MRDLARQLRSAAAILREAGSVVVCAHVDPDGDAIGSLLGATLALRSIGVDATPTLADARPAPSTYAFLPGFDLIVPAGEAPVPDVLLCLDAPNERRLGEGAALIGPAGTVVNIDHHPDNTCYGDIDVVDSEAACTGQLIWRMLPELGAARTSEVATCLYTALITDTGRFSYGNTDPEALRDAADMLSAGVDPFDVYTRTYESRSDSALRLRGLVLARVTLANNGAVAYSYFDSEDLAETGARPDETEDLIDAVRSLGGVRAVMLVKSVDGSTRVSLRAKTDVDVGAVARLLGGGGHAAAAGLTIDGGLEDALEIVLPHLPGGEDS
jgi:phosphoesterase RecJ-like protein